MKGDRERCLAGGMDGYVKKPIETEELLNEIGALTRGRSALRATAEIVTGSAEQHVDERELMERLQGDVDLLKEVVDIFVGDIPSQLDGLLTAIEANDSERIYAVAHRLKGAFSNIGAHHSLAIVLALEGTHGPDAKRLYRVAPASRGGLESRARTYRRRAYTRHRHIGKDRIVEFLIAEDEAVSRRILQINLEKWGHTSVACEDGDQAWERLRQPSCPRIAILDWMMPGVEGPELCRHVQELDHGKLLHIILLTARDTTDDLVQALEAGPNDYIVKPFDTHELKARVGVGLRVIELQEKLIEAERYRVLSQAAGAAAHAHEAR